MAAIAGDGIFNIRDSNSGKKENYKVYNAQLEHVFRATIIQQLAAVDKPWIFVLYNQK